MSESRSEAERARSNRHSDVPTEPGEEGSAQLSGLPPALAPALQRIHPPQPRPDQMGDPVSGASILNVANALTLLRLLLVPVFVILLVTHGGHVHRWREWAFVAFVVACVTDVVDGDLARRRNLVTDVGKIADPIADKALTASALLGMAALGDLQWWVTVVILARELGITALRVFVIRHGVIPASRGGKVKTLVQNIAIGLYLLPLSGAWATARFWVMGAALMLTVVTGADYVSKAVTVRRTSERTARKRAQSKAAQSAPAQAESVESEVTS